MEPDDLMFTKSHEWVAREGDTAVIGISSKAQEELNDIIFVELPEVGAVLTKGDVLATLESVKAAEEVYSPITGEVVDVNSDLEGEPERINNDPYGDGWIVKIKLSETSELDALISHSDYQKTIEK